MILLISNSVSIRVVIIVNNKINSIFSRINTIMTHKLQSSRPEIRSYLRLIIISAALVCVSTDAFATITTGTAFDSPLAILRTVFTGPIAYTAALLGIVVAGAMLVFGGEIGDFAKRLIMLVLVIAIIVLANNVLLEFFGASGATV